MSAGAPCGLSGIQRTLRMTLRRRTHSLVKSMHVHGCVMHRLEQGTPSILEQSNHTRVGHFEDLPDEIFLVICRYLSPTEVLNSFLKSSYRTSLCISDYSTRINLTNYSHTDLQYIFAEFVAQRLLPSALTISNRMVSKQIETFFSPQLTASMCYFNHVRQLSLLDCTNSEMDMINWYVKIFPCLHSLCLAQSMSDNQYSSTYLTHKLLCGLIFDMNFAELIDIELTTNKGIILDKQLSPNKRLKRLTISLCTIDDLLVLLDGLVPNLLELHVTLRTTRVSRRTLLPFGWSSFSMSHLTKFSMTTDENVEMRFEYLFNVVKLFTQLDTLTLNVKKWTSNDNMFVRGDQIEMIIDEFMPRLQHFYCSIGTTCTIDMTTFVGLNKRWPIFCRPMMGNSDNHLYTAPWSFAQLKLSVLANDDTTSMCSNVRHLTVDVPCSNLSRRFPNINTLAVLCKCELGSHSFPRLRRLITTDIEIVSSVGHYVHTLTLIATSIFSTRSTIYPNVRHLLLDQIRVFSLETIMSLVQCFPNLRSLNIQFSMSSDYFDSLDVLLDGQHLPHLTLLKTNWIDQMYQNASQIDMWMAERTILKWQSKPFLAFRDGEDWIVWL